MFLQLQPGSEYFVECRLTAFVYAVAVMQLLRAIDAQANQKLVIAQKRVPVVIQERAVGLQIVLDVQTRTLIFLFECDHLLEELDAQQRRLAALP